MNIFKYFKFQKSFSKEIQINGKIYYEILALKRNKIARIISWIRKRNILERVTTSKGKSSN
jgi:hypothetical protein